MKMVPVPLSLTLYRMQLVVYVFVKQITQTKHCSALITRPCAPGDDAWGASLCTLARDAKRTAFHFSLEEKEKSALSLDGAVQQCVVHMH